MRLTGMSGVAARELQAIEEREAAADAEIDHERLFWFAVEVPAQEEWKAKLKLAKLSRRRGLGLRLWAPWHVVRRRYSAFRKGDVPYRKPIVSRLLYVGVEIDVDAIGYPSAEIVESWGGEASAEAVERARRRKAVQAAKARLVMALRTVEIVRGVLHHQNLPTYVSGPAMAAFRRRHDKIDAGRRQEALMPRGREYAPGDAVRFEPGSGAFAEHKGVVSSIGETTCEVVLSLFGGERPVTVPLDAVGRASS